MLFFHSYVVSLVFRFPPVFSCDTPRTSSEPHPAGAACMQIQNCERRKLTDETAAVVVAKKYKVTAFQPGTAVTRCRQA